MTNSDVLVVGAGLSGLIAAETLTWQGYRVTVVDKGRSVGGRLATRRLGPGRADHGAQFFTARSRDFQLLTGQWLHDGLIFVWSTGWQQGSLDTTPEPDGHPRYAAHGGMNALAKHLAQDLNVQVNVHIDQVTATADGWQAQSKDGRRYTGRALLLTPPVPQSLALLDAGGNRLAATDRQALERISYAPALAGLFWIDGACQLPNHGAIQRPEAPITWLANNRQKGISPEADIITVHAGPTHSQKRWQAPDSAILPDLETALTPYLAPTATIVQAQLKRWRYALPTTLHPEPYLLATEQPTLVFAGDAFGGPRVEGAVLSGLAAAEAIAAIPNWN